jgi:hypothetical protein
MEKAVDMLVGQIASWQAIMVAERFAGDRVIKTIAEEKLSPL